MRARRVVVLPLFALLLAAPHARAADPAVAALKERAKFHLSVLKGNVSDSVKLLKTSLADIAKDYGDETFDAETAMTAAIAAVASIRDELDDGTFGAFTTFSVEGHQILLDNGFPPPGPDFMAGTGGVWDETLADAEAALDKADEQLRKTWLGFVKSMGKAAKKLDRQIDIRSQLPPHGEGFWAVVPPGGDPNATLVEGGFLGVREPQVLIVARIVETNFASHLMLGVRAATASVDLHLASTDADAQNFTTLVRDEFGVATGSFELAGLDHPEGAVFAHLDDGTFTSRTSAVSAPTLLAPDPAAEIPLKNYAKDLKKENKNLKAAAGGALKSLKALLASHVKAVKDGDATPELALRTGFSNLRDARETIGQAWNSAGAGTVATASAALLVEGVDDSTLPAAFQPDASGTGAKGLGTMARSAETGEKKLSLAFAGFAKKILAQAEKDGAQVGANLLLGRGAPFELPMVTVQNSLPPQFSGPPRIADGLLLVLKPALTEEFSLLLNLQAEVNWTPTLAVSTTTIPDGDEADLGDFPTGFGGTATGEIPLVADAPLLGWIFETGKTDTDQPGLMILMRPTIVGEEP